MTSSPSAAWAANQVVQVFPWESAPRYLLRDRDGSYSAVFRHRVRGLGLEEVRSARRSPWQNPYVERVIGTLRRELVDHVIVMNERHLRRLLRRFVGAYYDPCRTHLSLGKDSPEPRAVQPPAMGEVIELPLVGGLHHRLYTAGGVGIPVLAVQLAGAVRPTHPICVAERPLSSVGSPAHVSPEPGGSSSRLRIGWDDVNGKDTSVSSQAPSRPGGRTGAIFGRSALVPSRNVAKLWATSPPRSPFAMRRIPPRTARSTAAMRRSIGWWLLGLMLLIPTLSGCGYNEVIDRDEGVKAGWAEVQNQYQRRADLVPNLVKTVKGAANFEKSTLQAVVEARAKVGSMNVDQSVIDDPQKLQAFEKAQGQLSSALSRLMVVVEKYPELKATSAFRDLQVQLEGTENRIAVARRRYIEAVAEYNKTVLRFPSSIGARLRGKSERPTFTATTPGADKTPEVNF